MKSPQFHAVHLAFLSIMAVLGPAGIAAVAQPPVLWQSSYGAGAADELQAIAPGKDGGYLLAGNSLSGIGGNKSSAGHGSTDFWLVRIDEQGQAIWDKSYGGSNTEELIEVKTTSDGGFLLVGWSISAPGGNKSSGTSGGPDAWLVRLNADGEIVWDRSFGGGDVDRFNDAVELDDGGFLLCGHSRSLPGGNKTSPNYGVNDGWYARVNADGELLWEKTLGGTNGDSFRRIRPMGNGSFLLAGTSYSPPSEHGPDSNWGGGDYWYVQIDDDGKVLRQGSIGGIQDETLSDAQVTPDGGLVLVGVSWSPLAGWKSMPNFSAPGGPWAADVWLVRLDAEWSKLWDHGFGGAGADSASRIEVLPDQGILIAGYTDSAGGGNKTSPRHGREDFWLVRLEANGAKIWELSLGSSQPDKLVALCRDPDGGFLIGGSSWSATDKTKTAPAWGDYDFFLAAIPSDLPRLRRVIQTPDDLRENGFRMQLVGEPGQRYRVDRSVELPHWNEWGIHQLVGTELELLDPDATTEPHHFYRPIRITNDPGSKLGSTQGLVEQ